MDKHSAEDRRRYFRISETLGLAYRVIADDHLANAGEVRCEPANIYELLVEHDEAIAGLLEQLRPRDPVVAELANSLNKKINCIVNQLEMESRMIEQIAHKVYEVSLSACGLAFKLEEMIAEGSRVQLDLVLLPENRRIFTNAVVIGCETLTSGYYLRLNFTDMNSADQELLIQHIVKRQGDILRAAREQAEKTRIAAEEIFRTGTDSAGV